MITRMFSTITKPPIIVTNKAWDKIIKICNKQHKYRFIFSATSGGCNGYNYKLELLEDDVYEILYNKNSEKKINLTTIKREKYELIIEPLSEFLLFGTTIDYISEDYSKDVYENKFLFTPNKTLASSCGCGISFTPK
jgi:iron-sulfur cluster assembly accessory protein